MDKTTINGVAISDLQESFKKDDLIDLMKVTRLVELAPILNDQQYTAFLNALMHYSIKVVGWVESRASEQADEAVSDAARDVLAERKRQVTAEGWTPEHDDGHSSEEMAIAAACYAESAGGYHHPSTVPSNWPWPSKWWKPTTPRRDLVKAGALILAEIERLDRADSAKEPK